jgi:hypothetical protein
MEMSLLNSKWPDAIGILQRHLHLHGPLVMDHIGFTFLGQSQINPISFRLR